MKIEGFPFYGENMVFRCFLLYLARDRRKNYVGRACTYSNVSHLARFAIFLEAGVLGMEVKGFFFPLRRKRGFRCYAYAENVSHVGVLLFLEASVKFLPPSFSINEHSRIQYSSSALSEKPCGA